MPFAPLGPATRDRLAAALDPGLAPANPLDVWGTGRDTEPLFAECLSALAADPAVAAVALAVDLVPEFDGDESYPRAVSPPPRAPPSRSRCWPGCPPPSIRPLRPGCARPASRSWKAPAAACSPCATCSTPPISGRSRRNGPRRPPPRTPPRYPAARPAAGGTSPARGLGGAVLFDLLRDYGIPAVRARQVATRGAALAAAATIGYPVVLKTDEPGIAHKSDVGGVRLGLADPGAAGAAYDDLAARLGPRVLVCETAPPGAELALGIVRDAASVRSWSSAPEGF